ncbi:MAG: S41 family peptidase [Oscillospiraceae bacterium]
MNKKISVSIALSITLIAMTVTMAITMVIARQMFNTNISSTIQRQVLNNKISDIDRYARGNYYGEIDDTYLGDRVARGYVDGLRDSGAVYYTEKEYAELLEIENGKRVGIGIEVIRDPNNYFLIAKVYPDSPAAQAGITVGGYITKVDETDAKSFGSVKAMQAALRGLEGAPVTLTCLYNSTEEKSFTVQRVPYTAPTIDAWQNLDGFAYIRISSFGANTYAEFDYAVRDAQAQGVKGFVFDLRGNTGGQYEQAYKMIDLVCPLGTIAKAEYKNGTTKVLSTSDDENSIDLPMVVVVNADTSGAAELFAASIRNLAGGQLVGAQTAGKGMLQSAPQRLSDGSAVVVTVAKLLTGNDEAWDGTGLTPEVIVTAGADSELSLYNVDPRTDSQIVRATDLARSLARAAGIDVTGGDAATASEAAGESGADTSASAPEETSSAASE